MTEKSPFAVILGEGYQREEPTRSDFSAPLINALRIEKN
jgi:hypothetical protein